MKARLKKDYVYPAMRACAGTVFVKTEWCDVPAGQEAAALVHGDLEIEPEAAPSPEVVPTPEPAKKGRRK